MVRAAEAVRDGRAAAMVSAGNTGAVMASALLRMGRIPKVQRPAIATPLPVPGSTPTLLLDCGANAECTAPWLVQFAQMGAVFSAQRFGVAEPRVALLSIGEEPSKGTAVVKEATDGFTGNVVLKTLEGCVTFLVDTFLGAITSTAEARQATNTLMPVLLPLNEQLDPESYGGAMLLGINGVCIISHGSSSAKAIVNAVRVAREMVDARLVDGLAAAVGAPAPG
jgi:glycerol-3-phosphate acyltransferase PlsX